MRTELGEGLHLFKRQDGKSKYYWCGFHQDGKYHRKSTKTDDIEKSSKFAKNWYQQLIKKQKVKKKKPSSSITQSKILFKEPHRLVLYKRKGYSNWYCRFHIEGKLFVKSTQHELEHLGEEFAKDWYFSTITQIRSGVVVVKKGKTFEDVSVEFLKRYYQRVLRNKNKTNKPSESHYKNIKLIINNRLLPYFKDVPITEIDNTSWWGFKEWIFDNYNSKLSSQTLHQYKNSLRLVLNEGYRTGELKTLPVFKEEVSERTITKPREYFSPQEYKILINELRKNITRHKNTRWYEDSLELRDFVLMGSNSGCRVGELLNIRFCDVSILEDKEVKDKKGNHLRYLLIENIKGKRGEGGSCKTYFGCVRSFERIVERHGLTLKNYKKSTKLIFKRHHRDMFNQVLESCNLKYTNHRPKRRRDFVSLRHTYISFRLLNGVSIFEVSMNCRTSVSMILKHYNNLKPQMSKTINKTIGKIWGVEESI
jgi:integrase|tara:strand:- start:1129 stop:2568 length:1440 start_codon:yes stop_codon:yes gene_type:complete